MLIHLSSISLYIDLLNSVWFCWYRIFFILIHKHNEYHFSLKIIPTRRSLRRMGDLSGGNDRGQRLDGRGTQYRATGGRHSRSTTRTARGIIAHSEFVFQTFMYLYIRVLFGSIWKKTRIYKLYLVLSLVLILVLV